MLDQTQQVDEWRRSAQQVRRAWNAWLAADTSDQALAYDAFVDALAEEEVAAGEVERIVVRRSEDRSPHDLLRSG